MKKYSKKNVRLQPYKEEKIKNLDEEIKP